MVVHARVDAMLRRVQNAISEPMDVIVVDDDPIFRSLVESKLSRLSHHVEQAEDGAVAWAKIAAKSFHLALIDLEMPHMGGLDLIRCIRSYPNTCRMPIVVVTSRNDADAVRASLEAGATSFVTKPLNWSMFANHIEYLLRLHSAAERGLEVEVRVGKLLDELQAELGASLTQMADEARAALESRRSLGGEGKMAATLDSIVRQAASVLAQLHGESLSSRAGKEPAVLKHAG